SDYKVQATHSFPSYESRFSASHPAPARARRGGRAHRPVWAGGGAARNRPALAHPAPGAESQAPRPRHLPDADRAGPGLRRGRGRGVPRLRVPHRLWRHPPPRASRVRGRARLRRRAAAPRVGYPRRRRHQLVPGAARRPQRP
nr:hypothetical protein [Tanacetum cinerariifolium]